MIVLDLFSGIGGFSLGLHWAGFRIAAFCEADPFCRAVLARHWPGVPCYDDIRTLSAERLHSEGVPKPGLVCGGFPCQDVSAAGRGAGLDGARSRLWAEMVRLVAECRPGWVVVENVPALRVRGADRLMGELEALGYTGWPLLVGAAHAGAPHRRQRLWLVAHAPGAGLEGRQPAATEPRPVLPAERRGVRWNGTPAGTGICGVADGVPARVDRRDRRPRLIALGNAVVPANAAMIGRAILDAACPEAGCT